MTKKDFILLANVVRIARNKWTLNTAPAALEDLADDLASELGRVCPRFDRAKFLRACGVEEE